MLPVLDKLLWSGVKPQEAPQLVFIVGVPRSGSTYLYQLLTATGRYGYIDNLTQYLSDKSFRTALYVSNARHKNPPHDCFKSHHGNTEQCGLSAPNEGGKYFRSLRHSDYSRLKRDFQYVQSKINRPFVLKNLYVSLEIEQLKEILPEAKYIHLVRNRADNVQSILKARKDLNIGATEPWSAFPETTRHFSGEEELVNYQYDSITEYIEQQLQANVQSIKVSYEDLRKQEQTVLTEINEFIHDA